MDNPLTFRLFNTLFTITRIFPLYLTACIYFVNQQFADNIITSAFNTMLKQIADAIAKSMMDKAFANVLAKMNNAEVTAEQATQSKVSIAHQIGIAVTIENRLNKW
jgi:hypothetical protein